MGFFPGPFFTTLHFAAPNSMWFVSATWFVVFMTSCSYFRFSWIRATSSIHSKFARVSPLSIFIPCLRFCISFVILSISVAYSMTDRTPPCLMLSFIFIFLVSPCFVLILAVSPMFIFLIISRFLSVIPFFVIVNSMASSQALS